MRAVVQRVESCTLSVDGKVISEIGTGLVCYLGVQQGDSDYDLEFIKRKIANLRIFPDSEGKMSLSVLDLGLEVLVVPQFTLIADIRRGYRPSFSNAEKPEKAKEMYESLIEGLKELGVKGVKGGVFGADMTIDQRNRGPVTIILDSSKTLISSNIII